MHYTVNDRTYWMEDEGKGAPLLCLHGFTGSTEIWKELKADLPENRILSVDLPGHGRTGDIGALSMQEVAEDLKALLQAKSVDRVTLLGYSMGGRTALYFAATYPEMVERLILESASPGLETEAERTARVAKDQKVIRLLREQGIEAFTDMWEELPLFATIRHLSRRKQEALRHERLSNDRFGLISSLEGMGTGKQPSLWSELPHLSLPVCLIAGTKDRKYIHINEAMEETLPDAHFYKVEGAGHIPHLEKPEIFSEIIRRFMI